MRIDFVEISNFRRLERVRIDFSEKTTLFVGANNSGKTSAITVLRYFLTQQKDFSAFDIPLARWACVKEIGDSFEKGEKLPYKWHELLPSLDVWLSVSEDEIHHVAHLIPTLDWKPDQGVGVKLQLEPKDPDQLLQDYHKAKTAACDTLKAKSDQKKSGKAGETEQDGSGDRTCKAFVLWPEDLVDYLKKRMPSFLTVNAYLLDPSQKASPTKNGIAKPQELPDDAEPLEDNPFKGLIKIDEVQAHRGLSDYSGRDEDLEQDERGRKQLLTSQLRAYYGKHLDPNKAPEPSDIRALMAIHEAQAVFDERLKDCFRDPLCELEGLGYPGVANPRLIISTNIRPVEGLKHQSAVQYDLTPGQDTSRYRLPEQCNGLGYQNLISMVFRLISFRDDWMKVGKAALAKDDGTRQVSSPPLHLVLIEEPEAHLHVQVQQVFIRKAYEVLCNHPALRENSSLWTQLVVSTHSSHIAHEVDFAHMRYFRRHPARKAEETPYSTVVNLSEVFGEPDDTARFVSRYLQATHADLFFADGAIIVEGAAERMLIPHFIRNRYPALHSCYITLLEVGGSHAHRLAPLIKYLGLNTLIITDIDAVDNKTRSKVTPKMGSGLITSNNVLKSWHPKKENFDELVKFSEDDKELSYDDFFSVRVAYQTSLEVNIDGKPSVAYPATFEDSLVFDNIDYFRTATGTGLVRKFRKAIEDHDDIYKLQKGLLEALSSGTKAEFALDMLFSEDPASMKVPTYIHNGLKWLEGQLLQRQQEVKVTKKNQQKRQ
jgi:predicted ATP-dependent endonuclease of OLD family